MRKALILKKDFINKGGRHMPGRVSRQGDYMEGVKCVVSSCHYYGSGDHCMASTIEIQPPHASDTQDTDCATFIPKS